MRSFQLVAGAAMIAALVATALAQTWTPTGNLLVPVTGASATLLTDGRVLIAGGSDNQLADTTPPSHQHPPQAEIYNPSTGQFTPTGSLHYGRDNPTGVLLPTGDVLIVGGVAAYTDVPEPPPELYDPQTGTFSLLQSVGGSPLPESVDIHATSLQNGKFLVVGENNSAWLFDPATMIFTPTAAPIAGASLDCQLPLPDGDVLVLGGFAPYVGAVPDAPPQIYHVATGQWESLLDGPYLASPGCAPLPGGKILIAGGGTDQGPYYHAEIFDSATQAFSQLSSYPLASTGAPAFALPDGRVLLPWGFPMIFDPQTDAFSQAGLTSIPVPRTFTRLPDGSVLAFGSSDAKGNATASAEVFHETRSGFTFSLPATASVPTGFGSIPIDTTGTGAISFTCTNYVLYTCSISPNPTTAGQPASLNMQFMTGGQRVYVLARSGNDSYWAGVNITGPDLIVSSTASSQTVTAGATAYFPLKLYTPASFPASLSCANLPPNAGCTFLQNPVVTGAVNGPDPDTLVITTAQQPPPAGKSSLPLLPFGIAALLGMALIARRRWRPAPLLIVLASAVACGGSPYVPPPPAPIQATAVAPGTYTITVHADYNSPPAQPIHASTQITLIVQPES